ncbi:MAG: type II secretion system F family protein [Candidatus Aureabacteria bacterium]|nr:type II secretion system F family protein [Candidatus Auribacterota bacterium]
MPSYVYKVFNERGEIRFGALTAGSYSEAEKKLKDQGENIVQLKKEASGLSLGRFFSRLSLDQELFFYIQFSTLLNADVPLLRALEIVTDQITHSGFKAVLKESQLDIKKGSSLSNAFRKHEYYFGTLVLGMIEAGEESGKLDSTFLQISRMIEQRYQYKQDLLSAFSYPSLLFFISFIVSMLIITFVYPQFLEIFKSNEIALPFSTLFLAKLSYFLHDNWLFFLIGIAIFCLLLIQYMKSPEGHETFETALLKVPILGEILKMFFLNRLFFNMALLLKNDVRLLRSVEILAKTLTHAVMTRLLSDVWVKLRQGGALSDALKTHEEVPSIVQQIIVVGEQTGKLEDLLEKIASYYEVMISLKLKRLTMIIEPALLLVLGLFVGFLMASLLLPMFRMVKTLG